MDPELYKAAKDWNSVIIKQFETKLSTQKTPNGNTVLHVVADFHNYSSFVQLILRTEPNLLLRLNEEGETSFHLAARKGHSNVVRTLIEYSAANQYQIQEELISIIHMPNKANRSPFYLAVEKGDHLIAAMMLEAYKSPPFVAPTNFPLDGGRGSNTALHAAARRNFPECVELILKNFPLQTKRVDEFGWTSLHYAARFNHVEVATKLLIADRSMAYVNSKIIANPKEMSGKTALHVAVSRGHLQIIEEILSYCPDCWEMITVDQGKNVIHLAVENEQKEAWDFILDQPWAFELINQKDNDGNTPLHLFASSKTLPIYNLLEHPAVDKDVMNNAGFTPLDLIRDNAHLAAKLKDSSQEKQNVTTTEKPNEAPKSDKPPMTPKKGSEESHELERMGETYLIVATLIITISCSAAFTIPGGYDQNNGKAILANKPAFVAFIICDVLAMMTSTLVVAILLFLPNRRSTTNLSSIQKHCKFYIALALQFLAISLVTGLYVSIPIKGLRIFLFVFLVYPVVFILGYIFPFANVFLHELKHKDK